jgi:hypothetical protein
MLPWANTKAMQLHLDEISRYVAREAHAVILMDRAGWHRTGRLDVQGNLTIILLPSRSPELNPVEKRCAMQLRSDGQRHCKTTLTIGGTMRLRSI